ncbi:MAG: hypothetical protein K6T61_03945 [Bryobacteraceae bacterium]|nr:hypothetical protein [Bryobacteraceae bacterium]
MATFEFVASDEYRACLERDAEELVQCMKGGAWKSAHVMASSLIQAALTEYLGSAGLCSEAQLSSMPLASLLDLCRRKQVLSSRTVELAAFLRPFSDFLSPAASIRMEAVADETGARIAQALLEIIVNEIASHRRETYQYSADKIVAKVVSDPSVMAIADHLLRKLSRAELERLLLDLLPKAYLEGARSPDPQAQEPLPRLASCFRLAFDAAPEEIKRQAAARFLSVLENESEFVVQAYQTAFFRASDLEYLNEEQSAAIKAHFLSCLSKPLTPALVAAAAGMGRFLSNENEARAFFVPLVTQLLRPEGEAIKAALERRIVEEFTGLAPALRKGLLSWIARLGWSLEKEGASESAAVLRRLERRLATPRF